MRILLYHLVKKHRLAEPMAQALGKSKETLQRQILRSNPGYDERMRIIETFQKVSGLEINPIKLFTPVPKDKIHIYIH